MGAGLQGVPGHWLGAGKASSDLTLPLPLTQSFLARGHATSCPYKMGIPATQRIPSMGQQGAMWGDHQQTGAAGAKEWPLLQASGQCLGRRADKDNRAGTAALAEGLVFQAQQKASFFQLRTPEGRNPGGGWISSKPSLWGSRGNLWVWPALGTRLQCPASSPSHIPPKFFSSQP